MSLAKTTQRAQVAHATSIQRAQSRYDMLVAESKKDYADAIWNAVNDYIDDIGKTFPFYSPALEDLRKATNQQMEIVIYEKNCLNHEAIDELSENKIDWFAQPFFRGKDITLSQLLHEFEMLQNDAMRTPSEYLLKYMSVESGDMRKRRRLSS